MAASLVYDGAYAGRPHRRRLRRRQGDRAEPCARRAERFWSRMVAGIYRRVFSFRSVSSGAARLHPELSSACRRSSLFQAGSLGAFAAAFATTFVAVALAVAAPAIGSAFVMQIALGALSRVIPRFGSFTLAFPLAFAAALVATAIAVPCAARHAPEPIAGRSPRRPKMSDAADKPFEATPHRIAKQGARATSRDRASLPRICSFAAGGLDAVAIAPHAGCADRHFARIVRVERPYAGRRVALDPRYGARSGRRCVARRHAGRRAADMAA